MKCAVHGVHDDVYTTTRRVGDTTHRAGYVRTECRPCALARSKGHRRPPGALHALWEFGGQEYWFLRDMGLTPQQIGEKHGVKWESFQRTLLRRLGPKAGW